MTKRRKPAAETEAPAPPPSPEPPGPKWRTLAEMAAEGAGPAVGLVCPRCGCRHFHVLHTDGRPDRTIRRRRECRHCGWRTTTLERETDDAHRA